MKLTVKTLKGSHFQISVHQNDTVMAVKKNIEEIQGKDNYPCGQQLLIHNGKVLKDETTLAQNEVSEDGFLVVMLSKSKSSGTSGSASSQPVPSTAPTTTTPATSAAAETLLPPAAPIISGPASVTPLASGTSDSLAQAAASTLVGGNDIQSTIQQLVDMGGGSWDKDTVARALRAAYNNPERAVDYLYSGIPERLDVPMPLAPQSVDSVPATGPASAVPASVGPNSSPLNLFPQEGVAGAVGEGAGLGRLDFLRTNPQFQALRSMVQANPQILQPMLHELGKQNPTLLRQIQENQEEFLALVNGSRVLTDEELIAAGESEEENDDLSNAITITPAEEQAIIRMEAMGFDRGLVIEAFLACDRNEELAVNYLLENAADFQD